MELDKLTRKIKDQNIEKFDYEWQKNQNLL